MDAHIHTFIHSFTIHVKSPAPTPMLLLLDPLRLLERARWSQKNGKVERNRSLWASAQVLPWPSHGADHQADRLWQMIFGHHWRTCFERVKHRLDSDTVNLQSVIQYSFTGWKKNNICICWRLVESCEKTPWEYFVTDRHWLFQGRLKMAWLLSFFHRDTQPCTKHFYCMYCLHPALKPSAIDHNLRS